jgi:hypothetical protein
MKICIVLVVAGLAGVFAMSRVADAGAGDEPKRDPGRFKTTNRRDDDRIEVRTEKGRTVFLVHSPFGISRSVIERLDDAWPKAVVLRLHLKGLSSFQVSDGKCTVDAAVSLEEGKPRVRVWKDGKEDAPLNEKSPLWLDIRIVGGDGKPPTELPLKDGYFEVALPGAIFAGNPKSITLSWIDFYRS